MLRQKFREEGEGCIIAAIKKEWWDLLPASSHGGSGAYWRRWATGISEIMSQGNCSNVDSCLHNIVESSPRNTGAPRRQVSFFTPLSNVFAQKFHFVLNS